MISIVLKCVLCLSALQFQNTQAFWWPQPPTTTTTNSDCSSEAPAVLKQIPLTYFRTYTYQPYQPLGTNPFGFPFFGGGSFGSVAPMQSPLLNGPRYERYTDAYPAFHNFNGLPALQPAMAPGAATLKPTTTTTTAPPTTKPPTTTTSTTTTTTTTPAPTTTTTIAASSSTITSSTAANAITAPAIEPLINSNMAGSPFAQYNGDYPTYNRRAYMTNYGPNYYRPPYPYPDYSLYKSTPATYGSGVGGGAGTGARPSHIQFVPCMCPVSVGMGSGVPLAASGVYPPNPAYYPQSRTNSDNESEEIMSLDDDAEETKSKLIIEPEVEAMLADAKDVPRPEGEAVMEQLTNKIDEDALKKSSELSSATTVEEV